MRKSLANTVHRKQVWSENLFKAISHSFRGFFSFIFNKCSSHPIVSPRNKSINATKTIHSFNDKL